MTSDTDNATELYAAYFRMTMEEGKIIRADTEVGNGCVEENVNRLSGEISIAFHHCRAIAISVLMLILQRWRYARAGGRSQLVEDAL